MKKLNQRGALDMMFVVLLVVLLAFGGFVVWRVTAADNETADSAVSTQAGSESKAQANDSQEDDTLDSETQEDISSYTSTLYPNIDITLPAGYEVQEPSDYGEDSNYQNEDFSVASEITISNGDAVLILDVNTSPIVFGSDGSTTCNYYSDLANLNLTDSSVPAYRYTQDDGLVGYHKGYGESDEEFEDYLSRAWNSPPENANFCSLGIPVATNFESNKLEKDYVDTYKSEDRAEGPIYGWATITVTVPGSGDSSLTEIDVIVSSILD